MKDDITFVGMDVHKATIELAVFAPGANKPIEWTIENSAAALKKLARKLSKIGSGESLFCYEAGVCGFVVQRQLGRLGVPCVVVAPSLIPRKPGERIKTDRRDARKLGELLRAGLLTMVSPPLEGEEAVRDLCRARGDVREDLHRHHLRLSSLLLRRGMSAGTRKGWTQGYLSKLRAVKFEQAADQRVFDDYLLAVEQAQERLKKLDAAIAEFAERPEFAEVVGWLRCFRGVDTLAAMTILTEIFDLGHRFSRARQLMAYVGLVPREHSSGERERRGGITKTGNGNVRRMLVQCTWAYTRPARIGDALRKRRLGQPDWVLAIADRAQQRLHRRFHRLTRGGKVNTKALVAVARELLGFIWAVVREGQARGHASIRQQLQVA